MAWDIASNINPSRDDRIALGVQAAAATAVGAPAAPRGEGSASLDIPAERVTTLQGHTNEVFICAWSPTAPLLASG